MGSGAKGEQKKSLGKERQKEDFTKWPNRRMFSRQRLISTYFWGTGARQSCCQGPGNTSLQKLWANKATCNSRAAERRQMTAPLESSATVPQAAGIRQGKRKNKCHLLSSLSRAQHLFRLFPLPFGSLISSVILCQVEERKLKGRRPSTAGEARCLLCHAPLFPLPEGVLMLKYSPPTVGSCLLLPERQNQSNDGSRLLRDTMGGGRCRPILTSCYY